MAIIMGTIMGRTMQIKMGTIKDKIMQIKMGIILVITMVTWMAKTKEPITVM